MTTPRDEALIDQAIEARDYDHLDFGPDDAARADREAERVHARLFCAPGEGGGDE